MTLQGSGHNEASSSFGSPAAGPIDTLLIVTNLLNVYFPLGACDASLFCKYHIVSLLHVDENPPLFVPLFNFRGDYI